MEVKIIDKFFNDQDLSAVKTFCEHIELHAINKSKGNWAEQLTIGRGIVNFYRCSESESVYDIIETALIKQFKMKPVAIMFYYWQPESFITWHEDYEYQGAATIYLNMNWNLDNGGLFLYNCDREIKAVPPLYNRCVFQKGRVPHSTTSTHWKSPVRKTIQVFF